MKNLKYVLILFLVANVFSCFSDESSVDIQARIDALEEAINSNDYDAFRDCFDETAVNFDTYTSSMFYSLTDNGLTNYSFGTLVIIGNSVSCTATITGATNSVETTTFIMIERNGDYYIQEWKEGSTLMFDKK
ncbi:MAG TPA: hypothetical protein PK624_03265 [Spirochaetota bacterium]|nr:hypothetical protein [Spirochaetota bacterium]HOR43797.1 hypothetical protein [Spirochaetota bacterium]HPK57249.1 hypothetical protein [Spirochaetota bacterium]